MVGYDPQQLLFVASAFLFQIILILHFALRKWRFSTAMRFGPIIYAFSIPAGILSLVLLVGGKSWSLWLSGFIYLIWAAFGYFIEYIKKIEFRTTWRWSILGPYVLLYLAAVMLYWFPLALIDKSLWFGYAALFILSTVLNVTSHQPAPKNNEKPSASKLG